MVKYTSIVFLDIDGVLNSHKHFKSLDETRNSTKAEEELVFSIEKLYDPPCPESVIFNSLINIDPKAVEVFNEILAKSGAKVVISSSWRYLHPLEAIDRMLKFHGFVGEVVGMTSTTLDSSGYWEKDSIHAQHPESGSSEDWALAVWAANEPR